jgi:hypothetical protein
VDVRSLFAARVSPLANHSPGNAGNAEIAGNKKSPNAERIPVSTKERSLFLLLLTAHGDARSAFPAFSALHASI